jgi:hypothetical protein
MPFSSSSSSLQVSFAIPSNCQKNSINAILGCLHFGEGVSQHAIAA